MSDVSSSAPVSAPTSTGQADAASTVATNSPVDANTSANQAQPTPTEMRRMKLKIDGQETEMGEDEVIRYAQQGKAANQRFQEAAKMRKEAEDMVSLIKRNPRAVLEDPRIGLNFRQLAEEYLAEQLKLEMMTPEQKKYHDMEKKMRGIEEQERSQKAQQETQQMQQLQNHYANEYQKTITTALSQGGVPKTPSTVKRMAALMSKNLEHGLDLQPADLVRLVKEDYMAELKELLGSSDEDTLLGLLGDDTANKIRKGDLKRLKAGTNPQTKVASNQGSTRSQKPAPKQSMDDFFTQLKKS